MDIFRDPTSYPPVWQDYRLMKCFTQATILVQLKTIPRPEWSNPHDVSNSQIHNTIIIESLFHGLFSLIGLIWKSGCSMRRERGEEVIHVFILKLNKHQVFGMLGLAASSLTSDWLIFSLSIIHCWQGHPVNNVLLCGVDKVILSIAFRFVLLTCGFVLLTGWPCQ